VINLALIMYISGEKALLSPLEKKALETRSGKNQKERGEGVPTFISPWGPKEQHNNREREKRKKEKRAPGACLLVPSRRCRPGKMCKKKKPQRRGGEGHRRAVPRCLYVPEKKPGGRIMGKRKKRGASAPRAPTIISFALLRRARERSTIEAREGGEKKKADYPHLLYYPIRGKKDNEGGPQGRGGEGGKG